MAEAAGGEAAGDDARQGKPFAEVPLDFGRNLRACMRCKLLKTFEQARAKPTSCSHASLASPRLLARSSITTAARTVRSWTWRATSRPSRSAPRQTLTGEPLSFFAPRRSLTRACSTIAVFNPTESWSAKWLRIGACCRQASSLPSLTRPQSDSRLAATRSA